MSIQYKVRGFERSTFRNESPPITTSAMICLLATILLNCQLSYLRLSVKNSLPISAINFTQPDAVVTISYANITNNRGYGVYVNTTRSVSKNIFLIQNK